MYVDLFYIIYLWCESTLHRFGFGLGLENQSFCVYYFANFFKFCFEKMRNLVPFRAISLRNFGSIPYMWGDTFITRENRSGNTMHWTIKYIHTDTVSDPYLCREYKRNFVGLSFVFFLNGEISKISRNVEKALRSEIYQIGGPKFLKNNKHKNSFYKTVYFLDDKKVDEVVLVYSRHCQGSVEWAR